jgi:hypothetical protein
MTNRRLLVLDDEADLATSAGPDRGAALNGRYPLAWSCSKTDCAGSSIALIPGCSTRF